MENVNSKSKEGEAVTDVPTESRETETVEVRYYTDPLCCWSWAMEPAWRKLQYEFGSAIRVTYKMSGLLPNWKGLGGSRDGVYNPSIMRPEWMHAREMSGMEINDQIWANDPPGSSLPACMAVKCVEAQSPGLAARYLRMLREAVMLKSRNISNAHTLLEIATGLADVESSFNLTMFWRDLFSDKTKMAFRADWLETKYLGIGRLPSLIFRTVGKRVAVLSGYQTCDSLRKTLLEVCPGLEPLRRDRNSVDYMKYWHYRMTPREMEEYELA